MSNGLYIEAPLKARKQLEGTAYMFKYDAVVKQLLLALGHGDLPLYQAVVSDYLTAFLKSPTMQTAASSNGQYHNQLGMLRQYALNNVIRLLTQPTAVDVHAIVELQQAIAPQITQTQIQPIRLRQAPAVGKRLLKGRERVSSRGWTEGAIAISSPPIRALLIGLQRLRDATA